MTGQESDICLDHSILGEPHPLGVTYWNQLASELSRGAFDGAGNLLRKAMGALRIGTAEQARVYVERAVAIPLTTSNSIARGRGDSTTRFLGANGG